MDTNFVIGLLLAVYFLESNARSCDNLKPTSLDPKYVPRGKVSEVEGMRVYEIGPDVPSLLIGIHDINGFDTELTNERQIGDILMAKRHKVVIPDFFNGTAWSGGAPICGVNPLFGPWLDSVSWVNNTRAKLRKLLDHYENLGFRRIGLFGFSYGGHMVAQATGEFGSELKAAVGFTPAPMLFVEADAVRVPTFLVVPYEPTEIDYAEYCRRVDAHIGILGSCEYRQFKEMAPGFLSSTADWTNSTIRTAAETGLDYLQHFLCEHFER